MKKILLLGIGNVLYADEGVGVHFVNYIKDKYQFNHLDYQLDIIDGGTLAQGLIPIICQYDHLIVVDTVNSVGVGPGEVYFFDFDHSPAEIDWQGSAHDNRCLSHYYHGIHCVLLQRRGNGHLGLYCTSSHHIRCRSRHVGEHQQSSRC